MTRFFRIPMWKAPFFWHPGIFTYFSLRDFSRLLVLLVFNEPTVIFVWQPAINGYKKSKDSIWIGQHFRRSSISMGPPAPVAQLDAPSDWRPGGRGFNPRRGRQHSFVEIDHEMFSTVILSLPLIQEGQLSVSGERMCTILVNRLED